MSTAWTTTTAGHASPAPLRGVVIGLPMIDEAGRALLAERHQLVELSDLTELARRAPEADALLSYPPFRVEASLIGRCPRLKLIAAAGAGVDQIDVAAAQAAGIVVTRAVGAGALSVAEHAIAQMLAVAKRLVESDQHVRQGRFARRHQERYHEISGRTLAIVGYGAIGRELARIAHQGFGMRVIAVNRGAHAVDDPNVARTLPLDQALPLADIVSVHVPLTEASRGLIGADALSRMRPGAWLVDTSRSGVVDNVALAAALDSGQVGGAALDVFDPEPPGPDHPLLHRADVVLSPHNAGITREAYRKLSLAAARDIDDTLNGRQPAGLVGTARQFAASRAARASLPPREVSP